MVPPAVQTSGGPVCYHLSQHADRVALVTATKAPGLQLGKLRIRHRWLEIPLPTTRAYGRGISKTLRPTTSTSPGSVVFPRLDGKTALRDNKRLSDCARSTHGKEFVSGYPTSILSSLRYMSLEFFFVCLFKMEISPALPSVKGYVHTPARDFV